MTATAPMREPEAAREWAIARLKLKRHFAKSAMTYVSVNGILWIIWALADRSTDGSLPWPSWISIIWGFFLALDAWRAYVPWPASLNRPITEEDIERELRHSH